MTQRSQFAGRTAVCALLAALLAATTAQALPRVTPFAQHLNAPRGLKFGPDGALYIAEGGSGGGLSTTPEQCQQVPPPIGPYKGSTTGGRISKVDRFGVQSVLTDTFASNQTQPVPGPLISGVADVAFVGNQLYAITAGGGCSHGIQGTFNGVAKVNPDGSWSWVTNLSAFQMSHPTAVIEPDDFEPDGTWYSMVEVRGDLYAVEPNHGEVVKINPTSGAVTRVVDVSALFGHVVPTSIAYDGNFAVGNLSTFPQPIGAAKVWKLNPAGKMQVLATGFDMIVGVAYDSRHRLYVLELAAGNAVPAPAAGRITRVEPNGDKEVVADGLMFPGAMTFGPDGNLYVTTGSLLPAGAGEVVEVHLAD